MTEEYEPHLPPVGLDEPVFGVWYPIESAPLGGEEILIAAYGHGARGFLVNMAVCSFDDLDDDGKHIKQRWTLFTGEDTPELKYEAKYWMPLPPEPCDNSK